MRTKLLSYAFLVVGSGFETTDPCSWDARCFEPANHISFMNKQPASCNSGPRHEAFPNTGR